MEEEKKIELTCDECHGTSGRMVYSKEKRLCYECAKNYRPRFTGMHDVRISKAKYGVRMTVADCEKIKSRKSLPDGSIGTHWRWRG